MLNFTIYKLKVDRFMNGKCFQRTRVLRFTRLYSSIESDFLLIILKSLLNQRPDLRHAFLLLHSPPPDRFWQGRAHVRHT